MSSGVADKKIVDCQSSGKVLLENDAYTVLSLCEHPSLSQDVDKEQMMECCAPCPSYTTAPCSC